MRRFISYLQHDTTLAAILATFGIFPTRFPLYATAIAIEMHQKGDEYFVEVRRKRRKGGRGRRSLRCTTRMSLTQRMLSNTRWKDVLLPVDWTHSRRYEHGLPGLRTSIHYRQCHRTLLLIGQRNAV